MLKHPHVEISVPRQQGKMSVRPIRVVVAEDHQPFRQFLASELERRPDIDLILEVADGAAAVQRASDVQPELVLLDIGLPRLNGIQAARQIRSSSPNSKIVFVSQESSPEVVLAALETGAHAYVLKANAGLELMTAIDSVFRGSHYVSTGVRAQDFSGVFAQSVPQIAGPDTCQSAVTHRHEVGFYIDDQALVRAFASFAGPALQAGNAAIVIATEVHREQLVRNLRERGVDVDDAIARGRYIALDAEKVLCAVMVGNLPDASRFWAVTKDLIARAERSISAKHARVTACGECAPLLAARQNSAGAVLLEELWEEACRVYDIDVFCGYLLSSFPGSDCSLLEKLRNGHSAVLSV